MAELEKEQKATESATDKNLVPFEQVQTLGDVIAKSGMFPDVKSAAQAVVKILAGRELGFGPVYSMTKVDVVRGAVRVRAEMMAACIKRSGRYDYKVVELTDERCTLDFTDRGQVVYRSAFSTKDADKAHLLKGADSAWGMWARAMLFSKALSQGARIVTPHLIAGAYTIEEFGQMETIEGKVVQVVEEPKPKAESPQAQTQGLKHEPGTLPSLQGRGLDITESPEGHMVVGDRDIPQINDWGQFYAWATTSREQGGLGYLNRAATARALGFTDADALFRSKKPLADCVAELLKLAKGE